MLPHEMSSIQHAWSLDMQLRIHFLFLCKVRAISTSVMDIICIWALGGAIGWPLGGLPVEWQ